MQIPHWIRQLFRFQIQLPSVMGNTHPKLIGLYYFVHEIWPFHESLFYMSLDFFNIYRNKSWQILVWLGGISKNLVFSPTFSPLFFCIKKWTNKIRYVELEWRKQHRNHRHPWDFQWMVSSIDIPLFTWYFTSDGCQFLRYEPWMIRDIYSRKVWD